MTSEQPHPRVPLERFNLILKNCPCHTGDQVMAALCHFVNLDPAEAHRKMVSVHLLGQAIIAENIHEELGGLYIEKLTQQVPNGDGYGLLVELQPILGRKP